MEITSIETNLPPTSSVKPEQSNQPTDNQNPSVNNPQQNDRVEISSQAQSLSSATDANNSTSNIKTRQQAEQTVQQIRSDFQTHSAQAITAQANVAPALISNVIG